MNMPIEARNGHEQQVAELEKDYQTRKRKTRPTSHLAQAGSRLQAAMKRAISRTSACKQAQGRLDKTMAQRSLRQAELVALHRCLLRFEQETPSVGPS